MALGYFEKVHITNSRKFPDYNGKFGVILGISEEGGKIYGYAVHFSEELEGCMFLPDELEGTGEFVDRSEFYEDGDIVKVRVDGDEGSVIE